MSDVVVLNNGLKMPVVGLGTYTGSPGETKDAVFEAIRLGYRHLDAAWCYGNQVEVGDGIRKAIDEGIVKREDLFVVSKVWNPFHAKDDVEKNLRDTLDQLKLEYVDLFLVHWPVTGVEGPELSPPYSETWAAMEALLDTGLVKSIGVSNMTVKKLEAMKAYAKVWPAVNQVELHPFLRQDELLAYSNSVGTHLTAYSPLGAQAHNDLATKQQLLEHPTVLTVAAETGRSPGQVLLRWGVQRGTSVIPKSTTASRIKDNFDLLSWALSDEQFAALSTLDHQVRIVNGAEWLLPGGPYRTLQQLWDEEE